MQYAIYIQNCIVDCSFMFISGCHKSKTALIKYNKRLILNLPYYKQGFNIT